jgi:hypothetical protein
MLSYERFLMRWGQLSKYFERKVGLHKLNAVWTHSLKGACFQPLSLSSDILVSMFDFKCNLYATERRTELRESSEELGTRKRIERRTRDRAIYSFVEL